MPTAFSGVQVRAGLYFVVTRRWRGSSGRGDRGAQVDVPQPEDQVAGVEHRAVDGVDVVEPVDPADELEVARAPRRVVAHDPHVHLDRLAGGGVVPAQRQVHDPAGDAHVADVGHVGLELAHEPERALDRQALAVDVHLERADARA